MPAVPAECDRLDTGQVVEGQLLAVGGVPDAHLEVAEAQAMRRPSGLNAGCCRFPIIPGIARISAAGRVSQMWMPPRELPPSRLCHGV